MRADRRGLTLIELLVAVALLGASAVAMVEVLMQTRLTMRRTQDVEWRVRRATTLLSRIALEPRSALERRVGRRLEAGHEVRVAPIGHELFAITLVDTATGATVLETRVHRPAGSAHAR